MARSSNMRTIFPSKREFRLYMEKKVRSLGVKLAVKKSDKKRLLLKCSFRGCPYRVSINRPHINCDFRLGKRVRTHSEECKVARREGGLHNPSGEYLKTLIKPIMQENSEADAKQLEGILRERHQVQTNDMQCIYRARKKVIASDDTLLLELGKLADYLDKLKDCNPDSTTAFELEDGRFKRCFLSLKPWVHRYLSGTKLLFLDGTFLTGVHKGILLVASSLDANNNIFIVGAAIVSIENEDNWAWFVRLIRAALGNVPDDLTVISDREKGLINSVETHFGPQRHLH